MLPFSAPFAENIGDIRRISKIYLRMFSGELCQHTEKIGFYLQRKITFLANSASPATMGSPAIAG
jgi:hypothetical protein